MKILGIVPARSGSKGIPNKNIIDLCGKPLLAYTADSALKARALSRVVLSTDSDEIAVIGKHYGLEVPFMRPQSLARDETPSIEVVKHVLNELYAKEGIAYDAICLLQPTSPLRNARMIDEACALFQEATADTVLSVLPIPPCYHPDWALLENDSGNLVWASGGSEPPPRRQDLKPAFHREGSIYITKSDLILEHSTFYGKRIIPYLMNPDSSINIDAKADVHLAVKKIEAALNNGRFQSNTGVTHETT